MFNPIGLYSPIKDLFSWYRKRNEIKEVDPFILRKTSDLAGLGEKGLLSGPVEGYLFVRPESVSGKTEVPLPTHEVFFIIDRIRKTKRRVVCMANDRVDLVLLKKLLY